LKNKHLGGSIAKLLLLQIFDIKRFLMKKPELLLPAGNLDRLKTAILYGADAVYLGTPDMSLRVKSGFTLEDVVEGIEFAHARGKKVYF